MKECHLCKICKAQIPTGSKCEKCKEYKDRVKPKKIEIFAEQTSFDFEKNKNDFTPYPGG